MQQEQVENILLKLGLNKSEIKVFFEGLKLGPSTIIQLSQKTGFQRITTHKIVENLINKGLFLETKNKRKRLVYPANIKNLENLLIKKKQEIKILEQELGKAQKFIENLQNRSQGFANIKFYKGKEGINLMIKEMISDKQNVSIMCSSQYFNDLIDNQFLEKTLNTRKQNNLNVKLIFPAGFEHFYFSQGIYEQNLFIKKLPNNQLKGGINIRGNKVGFHIEKNGFITTTIIEDEGISQICLFLFENIWNIAKEYGE